MPVTVAPSAQGDIGDSPALVVISCGGDLSVLLVAEGFVFEDGELPLLEVVEGPSGAEG